MVAATDLVEAAVAANRDRLASLPLESAMAAG
jgi:hypothetical protein